MRIWDLPVDILCRQHLLGEHGELHSIWRILSGIKPNSPYRNHPETKRWKGKLMALYDRHTQQVKEMEKRGYNHKTPLVIHTDMSVESYMQDEFVNTLSEQVDNLKNKNCECKLELLV